MTPEVVRSFDNYAKEDFLRVALTSDLHFGERLQDRALCKFLTEINDYAPDLYLNLGDNSHGWNGFDKTEKVLRFESECLDPSILRAGCPGNHDFWLRGDQLPYDLCKKYGSYRSDRPPEIYWTQKLTQVSKVYKQYGCHYFDEDGPLRIKGYTFFGCTGWYGEDGRFIHDQTNDYSYMPWHVGGVPIHVFFQNRAEKSLQRNLDQLSEEDINLVFCSHFPLIEIELDEAGRHLGGSPVQGKILQEHFGIEHFLNGHLHQLLTGPQRFSAGSDYGKPKLLLLAFPLLKKN